LLLQALHVPAGPLVGAMAATAGAALAGRPIGATPGVYAVLLAMTGTATGASVTPEALEAAITWPLSIAFLAVATTLLTFAGYLVFRRLGGCDGATSFYAAAPGALSAVLALAQNEGADMSRVAVAQTLRLAALAAAAPFALSAAHAVPPPPPGHGLDGPLGWAVLIIGVAAGWLIARKLKWPSAPFLGCMAASALLHATGLVGVVTPKPLLLAVSAGLGAMVGARFHGVPPGALVRFLPIAGAALLAMAIVGMGAGFVAGHVSGVGGAAGMLAFAPGSMDVMIAIALSLGAAPAYVAAHHTARFLGLLGVLPWLARRWRKVEVTPS
jgi:hypothetical protein